MTSPIDHWCYNVAREYFPGADDEALGYILWNCTAYPCYSSQAEESLLREQLKLAAAGECEELPLRKAESAGG